MAALRRGGTLFLFAAVTLVLNDIQMWIVDPASSHAAPNGNEIWQRETHAKVLRLDPTVAPHCYRFLPNAVVRWLEFLTGDFSHARNLYRWTCTFLLLFAIYYYGLFFLSDSAALLPVLFYALIYPETLRNQAGQLTDPMSHLSFVLAFIFLESGAFGYLVLTVVLGSLAKETIVAIAFLFPVVAHERKNLLGRTTWLVLAGVVIVITVRLWITGGQFAYRDISGVNWNHVALNWRDGVVWLYPFLLTVGVFLPFLVLDWKKVPPRLKFLILLLLPILFGSSLLFSWLKESRNFVPVVIPLAVVAANFLTGGNYRGPRSLQNMVS
jgi:hypothetical protein